ncbi:MAG: PQQ-binding-like beta-propeller repeat protein [Luteitalea sp.]|nr:PQQ-binding-like beta-propeller repeat protein [Luteitalea sp.]
MAEKNTYSIFCLTDPDPRGSLVLGKRKSARSGGNFPTAIDPTNRRGRLAPAISGLSGGGGGGELLATPAKLVFSGNAGGHIVAYDAQNGTPLWHSRIGNVSNAPITFCWTVDSTFWSREAIPPTRSRFISGRTRCRRCRRRHGDGLLQLLVFIFRRRIGLYFGANSSPRMPVVSCPHA